MHCTQLNFTALYCTVLYCIILKCILFLYTALHITKQQFLALEFIIILLTAEHYFVLRVQCIAMYYTSLQIFCTVYAASQLSKSVLGRGWTIQTCIYQVAQEIYRFVYNIQRYAEEIYADICILYSIIQYCVTVTLIIHIIICLYYTKYIMYINMYIIRVLIEIKDLCILYSNKTLYKYVQYTVLYSII